MKKKIFRVIAFILCLGFLMVELPVQSEVQAATNYNKVYRNFLKKGSTTITVKYAYGNIKGSYKQKVRLNYFNLIDIDKNGVKELVVESEEYATNYYVFRIKNGKVRYMGEITKLGGNRFSYNPKAKGLVAVYGGSGATGNGLWQIKKGVLKETVEQYSFFNRKTTYELNYKKCSAKTAKKYFDKYFKSSRCKSYKFVRNNSYNINKLLK